MEEWHDPIRLGSSPRPREGYARAAFDEIGIRRTRTGTYVLWGRPAQHALVASIAIWNDRRVGPPPPPPIR